MPPTWTSDEELFARARRELFSAVIGDTLDLLGRRHQFLPPEIQPLRDDMVVVGRAMPVLEADSGGGKARAHASEAPNRPFGLMLRALDDLKPSEVYVCAGPSRTHASWDINGNGKTVLKGGWGRFDHERQQVPELDAADSQVRTQVVYKWHDLNGDLRYQPGEVNLDPNGVDFVSQSGGSNSFASTAEIQPKSDEFSITLERELMENFSARISGVYSKYRNTYRILNELRPYSVYNIPVTNVDPGPDGVKGNADDPGTSITYWEYSTALQPRAFDHFVRVNDPNADQTYKSIDMAVFKRLSNNWQLLASYSGTQRHVPISPSPTTAGGEFNGNVESGALNPNAEIFALDEGWESSGKLSGVYRFPFDLLTSVNFERRSGYYWARTVRFTGGKTIPNITIPVETIGSRQLPASNQFDVRFEKSFKLNKGQRVAVRTNVFNIINANTILDVNRLSGVNFLKPTVVMDPRIWEFSMTYSF